MDPSTGLIARRQLVAKTPSACRLALWTDEARPHPDVAGGALERGTYALDLTQAFGGGRRARGLTPAPDRFFAST
jgi:hypothetical protein